MSVWIQPAVARYIYGLEAGNENLVSTSISLALPEGFSIGAGFAGPEPTEKYDEFIGKYYVYKKRTRFFALLRVDAKVKPGVYKIPATVEAMACDEESCLPAEERSFELEIRVGSKN